VRELPSVLVIEDDPNIQIILEDALTEGGFEPASLHPAKRVLPFSRAA
jgi:DNA-binding response OmpR family regulator